MKDWLNSHITENDHVFVHDVTNQYAQVCDFPLLCPFFFFPSSFFFFFDFFFFQINIQGPQSREVMQQISHDDFSTSEFPYLSFK